MLIRRVVLGLVAVVSATGCVAQDDLSISSAVDSEQIKQFLQSDDPRLVAWGAYFASRGPDPAFDTLMTRRMAQWGERPWGNAIRYYGLRSKAIQAILYTLIEEDARVPIGSLIPNVQRFPVESLILAARLPTDELSSFLREWCEKNRWQATSDENWRNTEACTPVAAMLLAKAPPPGLAAKVLRESHEELSFWVLDGQEGLSKMKREEHESPGCPVKEDQPKELPPLAVRKRYDREASRWPPLFTYLLQNSASPYPGTLLVDAGGEAVTYRRVTALTEPTPCYPPPNAFYEEFKHHLLAEMLETNDESIPWPLRREAAFFLHDPAEFLPALKKQIENEEAAFRETAEALVNKGYLARAEAATVRPRLQVTVYDARAGILAGHSHPRPLPSFDSKDPLIKDPLISVGFDTSQSPP